MSNNDNYVFDFKEKIKYLIQIICVRIFGVFIKKNRNIWIFGGNNGEKYADNSRYFYEFILKYDKNIRAIWITNNNSVIEEVNKTGGQAFKVLSLKALSYILRAKVYVFSHSVEQDLRIYNDKDTVFLNLWHGMPIKKIMYDANRDERMNTLFSKFHKLLKIDILKYKTSRDISTIICSTSDYTKLFMSSAFRSGNVKVTGSLRGDIIYNRIEHKQIKGYFKKSKNQKLILYMPTHRNWGSIPTINIFDNINVREDLVKFCNENDCIFLIKYHPNEKLHKNDNFFSDRVLNISDYEIDVQELLSETDLLITDYSSCFIEFALLKRPIIFFAYDIDEYENKDMGLYLNYKEDIPGPIVYKVDELIQTIKKYIIDDNHVAYLSEYEIKLEKYNKYYDNKSGERIYNELLKLLL